MWRAVLSGGPLSRQSSSIMCAGRYIAAASTAIGFQDASTHTAKHGSHAVSELSRSVRIWQVDLTSHIWSTCAATEVCVALANAAQLYAVCHVPSARAHMCQATAQHCSASLTRSRPWPLMHILRPGMHFWLPSRWSRLQQMQLVLTDEAREAVTTSQGGRSGCRSAPRPVNYRSWDAADDSADCGAVTGHKGPMLDVSDLRRGQRTQVTMRWPEEMARGADGVVSLAHICNQTTMAAQQVRPRSSRRCAVALSAARCCRLLCAALRAWTTRRVVRHSQWLSPSGLALPCLVFVEFKWLLQLLCVCSRCRPTTPRHMLVAGLRRIPSKLTAPVAVLKLGQTRCVWLCEIALSPCDPEGVSVPVNLFPARAGCPSWSPFLASY